MSLATVEDINYLVFGLRFLASAPILGMLFYCLKQYGRERDFEESYAFKSALSFSLKPYLDLVESLRDTAQVDYQNFATSTIAQIFENTIEKRETCASRRAWRQDLKDLAELLKSLNPDSYDKAIERILGDRNDEKKSE